MANGRFDIPVGQKIELYGGLGLGTFYYDVEAKAGGVKVVPIDGVLPSVQSVHAKTYPYARPTFYYTNGEPGGLAKEFVSFTLGSTGQKIVQQVGFVPVP